MRGARFRSSARLLFARAHRLLDSGRAHPCAYALSDVSRLAKIAE
jgi:hypothetical protein